MEPISTTEEAENSAAKSTQAVDENSQLRIENTVEFENVVSDDHGKKTSSDIISVNRQVKFGVPAPSRPRRKTTSEINGEQFAPAPVLKSLTTDIVNLHRILMNEEEPEIEFEITTAEPTSGPPHHNKAVTTTTTTTTTTTSINTNGNSDLHGAEATAPHTNRDMIPLQNLLDVNSNSGKKVTAPHVPDSANGGEVVVARSTSTQQTAEFKNENVNGLHLAETAAAGDQDYTKESRTGALLAAFVACLDAAALGTVIGYASPAIPDIQLNRSPFHLDGVSQMAWVASMIALGEMVGGGISGPVLDRYGRKMVIIGNTVPFVIGWLIIAAAPTVEWLFVGRFVTGFCAGVVDVAVPVYLAEVSPADIRGFVGSCYELFVNLGIFFVFGFGCVLRYNWLAIACAFVPTVMMAAMCFMPETPRFLMSKGSQVGAQQALASLRGSNADTSKELNEIMDNIKQSSGEVTWRDFIQPTLYKPMYIVLGLMLIQQFSGYGVVYEYTVIIFSSAGIDMSPNLQTAIVGLSGVVSNLVSAFIVDRTGRRLMLFTSAGIMAVSMATMGIFFIVKENDAAFALNYISWLPILSLVGYNFGLNIGFGPIPFYMAGELFPLKTRGITCGICIAIWSFFFFLVSRYFMEVTLLVHDYGAYWILSGVSVLAILFVIFVVPETKGKTLEEIEQGFR